MIHQKISSIIQSRRSIYPSAFNGEMIEEDIIIQLLENANHAPSHKMTQPWRFKIFCNDSKKKLLDEIIKKKDVSEIKKKKLVNVRVRESKRCSKYSYAVNTLAR